MYKKESVIFLVKLWQEYLFLNETEWKKNKYHRLVKQWWKFWEIMVQKAAGETAFSVVLERGGGDHINSFLKLTSSL